MPDLPKQNRRWLLKQRPEGAIDTNTFDMDSQTLPGQLADGQVLLQTLMLSFEPAMRGWLDDEPSYLPPVAVGEVMRAAAVSRVIASNIPSVSEGQLYMGMTGWQEYALCDAQQLGELRELPEGTPPNMALSVFGGTSFTAYFGLFEVGKPQPGETVLVSGAAGATGSAVCQMAKAHGCRVIGIAGGEEKCGWLRDVCGIPDTIDYRADDLDQKLAQLAPEGIDLFFDNVAGNTLQTAMAHMKDFGRVALCGAIAGYNDRSAGGLDNVFDIIRKRLRIQGFVMLDYMDRIDEATQAIGQWVGNGELLWREDIQEGFDNIPDTLQRLFSGANTGKQLLKLAE